jgi:hypothetical protein
VIEYIEINGQPGYQPGLLVTDDKPGAIDFLAQKVWSPIEQDVEELDDGGKVHNFTLTSDDQEVTILFQFTTDFVENTRRIKMVPNSAKLTFGINNHVYRNQNASGLAIRVFVVGRGGVVDVNKDDSIGLDFTNQSGVNIDNDGETSRSFFTWDRFVTEGNEQKDIYVHSIGKDVDRSEANEYLSEDSRLHVSTIWFSVPNVTSFEWDPFFGMVDDLNHGSSVVISVMLSVFAVIALISL